MIQPLLRKKKYFGILFILMIIGCTSQTDNPDEFVPPRPINLPKEAVWAGGKDGGNWFHCKKMNLEWHYYCIVYNDYNASIIEAKGEFVMKTGYWDRKKKKYVKENMDSISLKYNSAYGMEQGIDLDQKLFLEEVNVTYPLNY